MENNIDMNEFTIEIERELDKSIKGLTIDQVRQEVENHLDYVKSVIIGTIGEKLSDTDIIITPIENNSLFYAKQFYNKFMSVYETLLQQ